MPSIYDVQPLGGLDVGQALGNVFQGIERKKQERLMRAEKEKQQQLAQKASDIFRTGSVQDKANFLMDNPQFKQQIIDAQGFKDNETMKARLDGVKRILSGEDHNLVAQETADAIRMAGGNPSETMAFADKSPEEAYEIALDQLTLLDPKAAVAFEKRKGTFPGDGKRTANIEDFEYYQRLKNVDPEGAKMFAKDVGLIPRDKGLSSTSEKALIDSQDKFYQSSTQSREYEVLADDYDDSLASGSVATFGEFIKGVTGTQDEATELRRRFNKVRLGEALKYLPPGPATDRDVSEAFKGVPKENASPEQVRSFLRGAAKMAKIDAEYQEFKANYISENDNTKGLVKAWKDAADGGEIASINELEPYSEDEDPIQFDPSLLEFMTPEERALFNGS